MSDVLTRVALAEAATASGDREEAAAAWEAVARENPVEGSFQRRLGEARFALGEIEQAIPAFEAALTLGAYSPAHCAFMIARCRARLGDDTAALAEIERALRLGFRSLRQLIDCNDLGALRETPRFRELTGQVDRAGLTREAGWRADLALLARETKRLAYAPWRYVTEAEFDAAVARIDAALPDLTDLQIVVELNRLLALLGDGHAGVYLASEEPEHRRTLPLQFFHFEEGHFIVASAPAYAELLGAELLAIDGVTIETASAALTPIVCRDNDYWLRNAIPNQLRETPVLHALGLIPDPRRASLRVRMPGEEVREALVKADTSYPRALLRRHFLRPAGWRFWPEMLPGPAPLALRRMRLPFWFDRLPAERLIYAQINRVQDHPAESLPDFSRRLLEAAEGPGIDRLVLDLRWNPGGNTFLEMPLIHALIGSSRNRRGQLFVIIGRGTFSAAQNLATLIERHTEAIFVGEPTGSSPTFVGETIEFELPYSGAKANVSDLLWQSGWPMDRRTWIAPLLYVPPTFAAFRENRDPALEAILALDGDVPGSAAARWR